MKRRRDCGIGNSFKVVGSSAHEAQASATSSTLACASCSDGRQFPRLAVLLAQQRVGLLVVLYRLRLRVELEDAADTVGDLAEVDKCAAPMRGTGVGVGFGAAANGV